VESRQAYQGCVFEIGTSVAVPSEQKVGHAALKVGYGKILVQLIRLPSASQAPLFKTKPDGLWAYLVEVIDRSLVRADRSVDQTDVEEDFRRVFDTSKEPGRYDCHYSKTHNKVKENGSLERFGIVTSIVGFQSGRPGLNLRLVHC
jgi:hypothetical protein